MGLMVTSQTGALPGSTTLASARSRRMDTSPQQGMLHRSFSQLAAAQLPCWASCHLSTCTDSTCCSAAPACPTPLHLYTRHAPTTAAAAAAWPCLQRPDPQLPCCAAGAARSASSCGSTASGASGTTRPARRPGRAQPALCAGPQQRTARQGEHHELLQHRQGVHCSALCVCSSAPACAGLGALEGAASAQASCCACQAGAQ